MTPQREGVDGVDCVALYLSLWAIISLVGVRDFNYSGTSAAGVTDEVGLKLIQFCGSGIFLASEKFLPSRCNITIPTSFRAVLY